MFDCRKSLLCFSLAAMLSLTACGSPVTSDAGMPNLREDTQGASDSLAADEQASQGLNESDAAEPTSEIDETGDAPVFDDGLNFDGEADDESKDEPAAAAAPIAGASAAKPSVQAKQPPSSRGESVSASSDNAVASDDEGDATDEGSEQGEDLPLAAPDTDAASAQEQADTEQAVSEYDALIAKTLSGIVNDGMTKLEKAKAIYNYARGHVSYTGHSDKSDWQQGAMDGINNRKGDCFTYYAVSRALLTAAGIDNLTVTRLDESTQHYWNLVNCGDGWYHFDACPRSSKLPPFLSFMFTDQQAADFTAEAGRNYYDFDGSLLPERATEIITEN